MRRRAPSCHCLLCRGASRATPLAQTPGFARARGTSPGVAPDAASCARATRRARSWTPPRLPRRRRRGGAAAGLGAGAAAGGIKPSPRNTKDYYEMAWVTSGPGLSQSQRRRSRRCVHTRFRDTGARREGLRWFRYVSVATAIKRNREITNILGKTEDFFSHLFDVRKVQAPVQPANYMPKRLGAGGAASCSTSASGGCCAPGRAPATYGAPSSVAASVLCRATLKNPHQRRSQPCRAAGRRAAGTRWARRRTS